MAISTAWLWVFSRQLEVFSPILGLDRVAYTHSFGTIAVSAQRLTAKASIAQRSMFAKSPAQSAHSLRCRDETRLTFIASVGEWLLLRDLIPQSHLSNCPEKAVRMCACEWWGCQAPCRSDLSAVIEMVRNALDFFCVRARPAQDHHCLLAEWAASAYRSSAVLLGNGKLGSQSSGLV